MVISSILTNDTLLLYIPYSEIGELLTKNSFFSIGKELIIKTSKGDIEIYMHDKNTRAALILKYQQREQVRRASIDSLVAQRFQWSDKMINPRSNSYIDFADKDDELSELEKRFHNISMEIALQDFSDNGKEISIADINMADFINLFFSSQPKFFDNEPYPSFLFRMKKMNKHTDIDLSAISMTPRYASIDMPEDKMIYNF